MNKIIKKILSLFKKQPSIPATANAKQPVRVQKTASAAKTENLAHKRMPSSKDVDRTVQKAKVTVPKSQQLPNKLQEGNDSQLKTEDKKKPKRYYYKHKNKKKLNKDSVGKSVTAPPSKPL